MTQPLLGRLETLERSPWGAIDTLRNAHERAPDLPVALARAIDDGSLELELTVEPQAPPPAPGFGLLAVLQWLLDDGLAERLWPAFFESRLEHEHADVRVLAARGLAAFPREAFSTLRRCSRDSNARSRQLALEVAGELFRRPDADPTQAREVLPVLEAIATNARGKLKRTAAVVVQVVRAAAAKPPRAPDLPERDDLVALAAGAPADELARKRIAQAAGRASHQLSPVPFEELADAAGVSLDEARAHAAAMVLRWDPPNVLAWSARGLRWGSLLFDDAATEALGLSAWTIEKLVLEARIDELDRHLAPTPHLIVSLRDGGRGAPALRWNDGRALSANAQSFVLACLSQPRLLDLTMLLASLLDEPSMFELGVWLLRDPVQHETERWVLPPSVRLVDELARAYAHGLGARKPWQYEGLGGLPRFRRWALRFWHESGGRDRDELRFAFVHGTHRVAWIELERWMPTPEEIVREGIASEAWWIERIGDALELAMVGDRSIPMHAFRRTYQASALARRALAGVVLDVEEHGLAWLDPEGRLRSETGVLDVAGHLAIRVVHRARSPEAWPTPSEAHSALAHAQRDRPLFAALPAPETLSPVRSATWMRRCNRLGYVERTETGGGRVAAWRDLGERRFEVVHSGYGAGYGGARPITFVRASGAADGAMTSELARDVRRLFGLDPMPETRAEPARVPAPEVLDAAFWARSSA